MERVSRLLSKALEAYDKRFPEKQPPCTGDMLCQRTGKRHRKGCIGRTEPFRVYAKGITNV